MARTCWLRPVAIVLVLISLLTGCTSVQQRSAGDDAANVLAADGDGAQKLHGGRDARAALYVVGCFVIVFVVVVDLLILPFTIPNDRPFVCTHAVVVVCYR